MEKITKTERLVLLMDEIAIAKSNVSSTLIMICFFRFPLGILVLDMSRKSNMISMYPYLPEFFVVQNLQIVIAN